MSKDQSQNAKINRKRVKRREETLPTEDSKLPITSSLFRSMRLDAALRKGKDKRTQIDLLD